MAKLPPGALNLFIILTSCLAVSLALLAYSLVRLRRRWREGREALKSLHEEARSMQLEMHGRLPETTSDAGSGAKDG